MSALMPFQGDNMRLSRSETLTLLLANQSAFFVPVSLLQKFHLLYAIESNGQYIRLGRFQNGWQSEIAPMRSQCQIVDWPNYRFSTLTMCDRDTGINHRCNITARLVTGQKLWSMHCTHASAILVNSCRSGSLEPTSLSAWTGSMSWSSAHCIQLAAVINIQNLLWSSLLKFPK